MSEVPALADFAGAYATITTSRKTIVTQYITAERAKWRDKIRDAVSIALLDDSHQTWKTLWLVLELNTNPLDRDDIALVDCAKRCAYSTRQQSDVAELLLRVALLLKHDWERAKIEAGTDMLPPRRIPFEEACKLRSGELELCDRPHWTGQLPGR